VLFVLQVLSNAVAWMANDSASLVVLSWMTPVIFLGVVGAIWQLRTRLWRSASLKLHAIVNISLGSFVLYTASLDSLLKHEANAMYMVISEAHLERTATLVFFVAGCIMLFEGGRSVWRARTLK